MNKLKAHLGANVRRYRIERDWTQVTLTAAAHIDRNTVGAIENCRNDARLTNILALAGALGVSPYALLLPAPTPPSGTQEAPTPPSGTQEAPTLPSGTQEAPTPPSGTQEAPTLPSGTQEAPTPPSDTQEAPLSAPTLHWHTFAQVLQTCRASPDAIRHYLERAGIIFE